MRETLMTGNFSHRRYFFNEGVRWCFITDTWNSPHGSGLILRDVGEAISFSVITSNTNSYINHK
jgi:hypothetical protein